MLDIANQLLTRHLPFALLCHVNEWQSLHQSQSKFLGLLMLKHWKIRITHKQFSLRGEKPKYKRKNRRLRTLAAENKKRQLEDLPQANFGRLPENIFSFS